MGIEAYVFLSPVQKRVITLCTEASGRGDESGCSGSCAFSADGHRGAVGGWPRGLPRLAGCSA